MQNSTTRTIISFLGALLGLYALYFFRDIIGYLLVSVALSFAGRPIVNLISKIKIKGHHIPSAIGAAVALVCFIVLGSLLLALFGPLVTAEAKALSSIDPQEISNTVRKWLSTADSISSSLNISDENPTSLLSSKIQNLIGLEGVGSIFSGLFGFLGSAFIAIFSILFMTFFFLKDAALFHKMIITLTPNSQVEKMEHVMESSSHLLTRYFSGLIIQVTIVSVMVSSGLAIIGSEHALLLGFIAGIFNLIPYLGPLASTGLGLIIVATTYTGDPSNWGMQILYAAIVYGVVQLVDNFFTQPFIFSNRVMAHPLEIFIVISMAGLLGGVSGMVLAIPGYTLIRIVAREYFSGFKLVDALTEKIKTQ
ncbi:MAG TPA: AI-2E family transporter [Flavobacteriales bacterium]|jgi:predicted PurR-regulated permease PerM|nr:AI-2E family transporter [Flavobacteriales bacterium]HIN42275.1 AI-2E family transporter [Flavobacteriales bacterium]